MIFSYTFINSKQEVTIKKTETGEVKYYHLLNNIYAEEKDPIFIHNGKEEKIKDYLRKTNCTYECIYDYKDPIIVYRDGGTKIYEYQVYDKTYYLLACQRLNTPKKILITQNKASYTFCEF